MILDEICFELKNYFSLHKDRIIGDFSVANGKVVPPLSLLDNQYYRIVGSVFNDGIHRKDDLLIDEPTFHGAVWLMRIPQDILDLADDIEKWMDENAKIIDSPYMSESFGGYNYSKGSNYDGTHGLSWKNQSNFSHRLNKYRRIRIV